MNDQNRAIAKASALATYEAGGDNWLAIDVQRPLNDEDITLVYDMAIASLPQINIDLLCGLKIREETKLFFLFNDSVDDKVLVALRANYANVTAVLNDREAIAQ